MKFYVKTMTSIQIRRLFCLLIVTALILPIFSGCSGETILSEEQIKAESEKIRLDNRFYPLPSIQEVPEIPCVFMGNSNLTKEDRRKFGFVYEFIPCDTYTVRGVEYELVPMNNTTDVGVYKMYDPSIGDYVYTTRISFVHPKTGNKTWCKSEFVGESQIPLEDSFPEDKTDSRAYLEMNEDEIDILEIENTVKKYIEGKYKDSGVEVDLSEYKTVFVERDGNLVRYRWALFVNNVLIHEIESTAYCSGELHSFKASGVPVDENVIAKIPNYTRKQYADIGERFVDDLLASYGIEASAHTTTADAPVTTLDFYTDSAFKLDYIYSLKRYAVKYVLRYEGMVDGKEQMITPALHLLLD